MAEKPKHLSLTYAEQFKEQRVVDAYVHRPPIPAPVLEKLLTLIVDEPRVVLDAGCGMGPVARTLVSSVARVDAVDFSHAMIAAGRQLPNGDHPNLRWIESSIESVPLAPPYALIVTAGSLHWMDWAVVMPRFRQMLSPNGVLAIVWQSEVRQPWHTDQLALIQRYSTNREFQSYNLLNELTTRGLFQRQGECHTEPVAHQQSIPSYIESMHSRNGFSRERMTAESAQAFDDAMDELLRAIFSTGTVAFEVVGHVVWGNPAPTKD